VLIWEGNGSRQYLDSIGLKQREEGDLGPIYGFQWRHWNAPYTNMHSDYSNQGIDQLAWLIKEIKTNPSSRRLILSAWNLGQLKEMALPPCHVLSHFNVTSDGRLNCLMYQRSCDMGLGVPFNIASYALLTCMIAHVTGLKRGEFVHVLGDSHIYHDHMDKLKPQLSTEPYPFPYLKLDPAATSIDNFTVGHITLENYLSHAPIKMKMAV
jgi:dihydrofolate reductase/thymidylate synthase